MHKRIHFSWTSMHVLLDTRLLSIRDRCYTLAIYFLIGFFLDRLACWNNLPNANTISSKYDIFIYHFIYLLFLKKKSIIYFYFDLSSQISVSSVHKYDNYSLLAIWNFLKLFCSTLKEKKVEITTFAFLHVSFLIDFCED